MTADNPFAQLVRVCLRGHAGRAPEARVERDNTPIPPLDPKPRKGTIGPAMVRLLEQYHHRELSTEQLAAAVGLASLADVWGLLKQARKTGRVVVARGLWRINPDWTNNTKARHDDE
jgi:hypothetical protein